jgi:predicted ATPase
LRLDPLGEESAAEMGSALLGGSNDLDPLKRLIIERTEGNPFFIEEMVQMLFDESALVRNGSIQLTRPLRELKIPPTVQDILASRIDRLPPDRKDLLQTLAVIGKEFKLGLVRKVAASPESELEPMLSELQLGEFVYEQPAVGDVEFTFKHALTHDVAYIYNWFTEGFDTADLKDAKTLLEELNSYLPRVPKAWEHPAQ